MFFRKRKKRVRKRRMKKRRKKWTPRRKKKGRKRNSRWLCGNVQNNFVEWRMLFCYITLHLLYMKKLLYWIFFRCFFSVFVFLSFTVGTFISFFVWEDLGWSWIFFQVCLLAMAVVICLFNTSACNIGNLNLRLLLVWYSCHQCSMIVDVNYVYF